MWYHATGGKGQKDMVVLPYKDRLLLFSRYLQQLVMESLGKRLDLDGKRVDQGISVYGNKGSTDQHAYVQQLRDGVNNFFVTFIRVLESGGAGVEVEPGVDAGDFLHGFLLGTRAALFDNDRQSMTITRAPRRCPHHRRADRSVRACRRLLRHSGERQRLSPTGRRGRQEGGGGGAGLAGEDCQGVVSDAADSGADRHRPSAPPSPPRRCTWCWNTWPPTSGRRRLPPPIPARVRSARRSENSRKRGGPQRSRYFLDGCVTKSGLPPSSKNVRADNGTAATPLFVRWQRKLCEMILLGNRYAIKDGVVLWGRHPIPQADPATFQSLGGDWGRDARHVYVQAKVKKIDIATFEFLNPVFVKDANAAYDGRGASRGQMRKRLRRLTPAFLFPVKSLRRPGPVCYARHCNAVYFHDQMFGRATALRGADPKTFVSLRNDFGMIPKVSGAKEFGCQELTRKRGCI